MKKNNIFGILNLFLMIFIFCVPISFSLSLESSNPKISITLDKLHEVTIEVKKLMLENDDIQPPVLLTGNEQMILTLTKIKEHPGEADFQQFADYSPGSEITMKLVPGDYYINGQFVLNEEVIIPERTDTYCKATGEQIGSSFAGGAVMTGVMVAALGLGPPGWIAAGVMGAVALIGAIVGDDCLGGEEEVVVDEVKLDPAILGGVEGNITLSNNLYSKDKLTFYTFAMPPPQIIEDLNVLGLIRNITTQNIYRIQPR